MKKIIFLAASAVLLSACNQSKPGYTITGSVSNPALDGEYVYLYEYGDPQASPKDSVTVEKGMFMMEGSQAEPQLCVLSFADDITPIGNKAPGEEDIFTTVFVLENGNLKATLDSTSSVTGTPENDELKAHKESVKKLNAQKVDLIKKSRNYKELGEADKAEIKKLYDVYIKQRLELAKNYIESHLHKLSGGYIFGQYVDFMGGDIQHKTLQKADSTFKSAPGVAKICKTLDTHQKVCEGNKFTDFSMKCSDGTTKKLSEFAGNGKNYVLVDFWASWCPPCRKDMPELVALYKMYKDKGLEVVGVSLDENQTSWMDGIKDMQMTWPQLSDLKGWHNEAAVLYGIKSIPQTMLIAPDGTIVAWGLSGDALKDKLKELIKK